MKMIQCILDCKYQRDGYCGLETISTVNSLKSECPHYDKKLSDKRERFPNISDSYKLH